MFSARFAHLLLPALSLILATHTPPADPEFNLDAIAQRIHTLINEAREAEGLPPLKWSDELASQAINHSSDQAEHNYFSHEDRAGRSASERAKRAGYTCERPLGDGRTYSGIGENIFHTFFYTAITTTVINGVESEAYEWKSEQEIAREAVSAWMNSPGHRKNILTPHYQEAGLGLATRPAPNGADGEVWVTQTFC